MKKGKQVWVVVALILVVFTGAYYKSIMGKPGSGVTSKIISNPGYVFDHSAHHSGGGGF